MNNRTCIICDKPTKLLVEVTDGTELVEVPACDQHKAEAKRRFVDGAREAGVVVRVTERRINPKKHKADRRRVGRFLGMDISNTAMGHNDSEVTQK
jgi:hypothetical protein